MSEAAAATVAAVCGPAAEGTSEAAEVSKHLQHQSSSLRSATALAAAAGGRPPAVAGVAAVGERRAG